MTYEQIEKEFDEYFAEYIRPVQIGQYNDKGVNIGFLSSHEAIKSFLKQSFIKYLKDEVERLEKTLIRNEEFGFCKHCPFHKGDMEHDFGKCAGHDEAISYQITNLQAQIKELEV